jgi:hypothetical protein
VPGKPLEAGLTQLTSATMSKTTTQHGNQEPAVVAQVVGDGRGLGQR